MPLPLSSLPLTPASVPCRGAGLPLNAPEGVEFICDAMARVAICGDWLIAPSTEAAAISGLSLADHVRQEGLTRFKKQPLILLFFW